MRKVIGKTSMQRSSDMQSYFPISGKGLKCIRKWGWKNKAKFQFEADEERKELVISRRNPVRAGKVAA